MRVEISKLRAVTAILFDQLEGLGFSSIDIEKDYYWDIQAPKRYDVHSDPGKPTIGQLSDDWAEMQRMLANPEDSHPYALVWLAALLRYVGEEIVSQNTDQGAP
jgi:hypothetical protein